MNKQKGNMYGFVTHTWNPIKGTCKHDCNYCYMKVWGNWGPLRIDPITDDLGNNNYIFIGSSTDMFSEEVPKEWIKKVLKYCCEFKDNKYLFQTKNPRRFIEFADLFPKNSTLCITLETNRLTSKISNAPSPFTRVKKIEELNNNWVFPIMVTIEPILDFDLLEFTMMIKRCTPFQVNIGADSKGHNLDEPSYDKAQKLIKELQEVTITYEKSNLLRLKK